MQRREKKSAHQARGRPTDTRSDIWSFGCVFYEMLTGKISCKGETISETLAIAQEFAPYIEDDGVLFFTRKMFSSAKNGHVFGLDLEKSGFVVTKWSQHVTV